MRARGAKVTGPRQSLSSLRTNGVMPQTREAVNHAKAAGVADHRGDHKIDKPEAKPDRIKQELSPTSSSFPRNGRANDLLRGLGEEEDRHRATWLEMVLIQADMLELKANPDKMARAPSSRPKLDQGSRDRVATGPARAGTLRQGDIFVSGTMFGRVRALKQRQGERVELAGPAVPVEVIGFSGVPTPAR